MRKLGVPHGASLRLTLLASLVCAPGCSKSETGSASGKASKAECSALREKVCAEDVNMLSCGNAGPEVAAEFIAICTSAVSSKNAACATHDHDCLMRAVGEFVVVQKEQQSERDRKRHDDMVREAQHAQDQATQLNAKVSDTAAQLAKLDREIGDAIDSSAAAKDDAERDAAKAKIKALREERSAVVDSLKTVQAQRNVAPLAVSVKLSKPRSPVPSAHHAPHTPAGSGDSGLDLEDADEGTPLDMDTIFGVYSRSGAQLGACLQANGTTSVTLDIVILGTSGRVVMVEANGARSGPVYDCVNTVLRGMKFPTATAPRTKAEFDVSL